MDGEKIIIPGSGKASDPDVEVNLDTIQAGEPEKPQISPEAAKTPQPENVIVSSNEPSKDHARSQGADNNGKAAAGTLSVGIHSQGLMGDIEKSSDAAQPQYDGSKDRSVSQFRTLGINGWNEHKNEGIAALGEGKSESNGNDLYGDSNNFYQSWPGSGAYDSPYHGNALSIELRGEGDIFGDVTKKSGNFISGLKSIFGDLFTTGEGEVGGSSGNDGLIHGTPPLEDTHGPAVSYITSEAEGKRPGGDAANPGQDQKDGGDNASTKNPSAPKAQGDQTSQNEGRQGPTVMDQNGSDGDSASKPQDKSSKDKKPGGKGSDVSLPDSPQSKDDRGKDATPGDSGAPSSEKGAAKNMPDSSLPSKVVTTPSQSGDSSAATSTSGPGVKPYTPATDAKKEAPPATNPGPFQTDTPVPPTPTSAMPSLPTYDPSGLPTTDGQETSSGEPIPADIENGKSGVGLLGSRPAPVAAGAIASLILLFAFTVWFVKKKRNRSLSSGNPFYRVKSKLGRRIRNVLGPARNTKRIEIEYDDCYANSLGRKTVSPYDPQDGKRKVLDPCPQDYPNTIPGQVALPPNRLVKITDDVYVEQPPNISFLQEYNDSDVDVNATTIPSDGRSPPYSTTLPSDSLPTYKSVRNPTIDALRVENADDLGGDRAISFATDESVMFFENPDMSSVPLYPYGKSNNTAILSKKVTRPTVGEVPKHSRAGGRHPHLSMSTNSIYSDIDENNPNTRML